MKDITTPRPTGHKSRAEQLRARAELALARGLFNLPSQWQVRISGQPSIELDGQRLHPDMQLLLATMRWRNGEASLAAEHVSIARANLRDGATRYADTPEVGPVRELTIDAPHGPLRARHYAPQRTAAPAPLLVFLHGGGFALGDLDTHDLPCRLLCRHAEVHVLSIDYRLAPEFPFPAALEDGHVALRWASEHAAELGADPQRIALGGDSAGGNLSAVIAQDIARDGGPALRAQLLIYPCTDLLEEWPSRVLFGKGMILTRSDMDWFNDLYTRPVDRASPRISPLRAASLAGLPPALVVTAGFDPLRDEGEAYAEALRKAGNRVVSWRERGLLHGYINYAGLSRECRSATKRIGTELAALLR
ncbi:MAG: alpha/beta hydrolase [Polyangiales bacterium]